MKKFQSKCLLNCLTLFLALACASCGYFSDKPPVNVDLYTANELQTCKIDVSKLGDIFKADQKEQIKCLQENFIQFTKYVRSQEAGSISEVELNAFVRKFFQGQSDSIAQGLSLIFQLNMLLLKDEATKISRNNISPLFDLLVQVNQEAIIITQILKDVSNKKDPQRFWEFRAQFQASVTRFADDTIKIIAKAPGLEQQLNIKEFILEASKKLGSKEINRESIDSFLFLKRILAGGEKEIITTSELTTIISKLPKILTLSFDLYYLKDANFTQDTDQARFYLANVRDLYSIIQFQQNDFQLFTIDQLLRLAGDIAPEKSASTYKPSLAALKSRLIGGNKDSFFLQDLKSILEISQDFFERNYFSMVTYNAARGDLEKNEIILNLPQRDLPNQYDLFSAERVAQLHRDFQDTAVNIRYFRSEKEGIPYYGNAIKRNKFGFLESGLLQWVSTKLLEGYGHKNSAGLLQVSLSEFQTFLNEMKPILEKLNLWSPTPATFARNTVLLADLFQNSSNGDLEVNVTEASEYIQMILSAIKISDTFIPELSSKCDGGSNSDGPLFETTCFNQSFFNLFLNKMKLKAFFPRLNDYIVNTPPGEINNYLTNIEGFARDNPDPLLPITKRDIILIFGSMLNIESTFIRFDTNKDDVIDFQELIEAFKIYKSAIIALAKLKPTEEVYAQSIFLYMVSKMEIPPTGSWTDNAKFFSFHQCVSNDFCRNTFMSKIEAKRLNIGKLLYYVVNQKNFLFADTNNDETSPF